MIQTNNNIPLYAQTPPGINLLPQQIHNTKPSIYNNPIPVIPVQGPFEFPVFANYQPEIKKIDNHKHTYNVSHANLNDIRHIYQDILPKPKNPELGYFALISDRLNIYEYFEIIFGTHYNEHINTPTREKLTYLFEHIKVNGYNTYFTNSGDNAVSSLITIHAPKDFLMFNICYPIILNNDKNIVCDANSQKSNMRVYKIVSTDPNIMDKLECEKEYYKKTRDIIKRKKCPNFVLSYGMLSGNYEIDWDNIAYMKNEIPTSSNNSICFVNLTESISQNIIKWASPVTETTNSNDVVITIMNNSGSKNLNTWKNVLFQLLIGMYFLIKDDIIFDNFSLAHNVYIKSINSGVYKYWKYIINGVEYFVPNNGILVMFDSNFKHSKIGLKYLKTATIFSNLFEKIKLTGERKELIDKINEDLASIDKEIAKTAAVGELDLSNLTPPQINTLCTFICEKLIYIIVSYFHEYISDDIGMMVNDQDLDISYNKMVHYDNYKTGDLVVYNINNINIVSVYKDNGIILTNTVDINRYGIDENKLEEKLITHDLITKIVNISNSKEVIDIYRVS